MARGTTGYGRRAARTCRSDASAERCRTGQWRDGRRAVPDGRVLARILTIVVRFAADRIGKARERRERTAHAHVLLPADLRIEQHCHARFAREFDEIHLLSLWLRLVHSRRKCRWCGGTGEGSPSAYDCACPTREEAGPVPGSGHGVAARYPAHSIAAPTTARAIVVRCCTESWRIRKPAREPKRPGNVV